MRTRSLGNTGLKISEIVLGGGRVGGLFTEPVDASKASEASEASETASRVGFQCAMESGVNWIDTAPQYGDGRSEKRLGKLLHESGAKPYISTKVRLDPNDLDDVEGAVEASLEASLTRLGRSRVDLLQLHNRIGAQPGMLAPEIVLGPVAAAMAKVKRAGLTGHIGLTALGQTDACLTVIASGVFETAQIYYNLINPSAARTMPVAWRGQNFGGLIAAARNANMGLLAIRVFAAGALATGGQTVVESDITLDSQAADEQARARSVFAVLAGDPAEMALRFALTHPDISAAIVGAGEPGHIEAAVRAAEKGPLSTRDLDRLETVYQTGFAG